MVCVLCIDVKIKYGRRYTTYVSVPSSFGWRGMECQQQNQFDRNNSDNLTNSVLCPGNMKERFGKRTKAQCKYIVSQY